MLRMLNIAEQIFEDSLLGKTSRYGIAISDCRKKETMIIFRYGGDIILSVFDNNTKQRMFDFVIEMKDHNQDNWSRIFRRFVEIKAQLM